MRGRGMRGGQRRAVEQALRAISRKLGLNASPQVLGIVAAVVVAMLYGISEGVGPRGGGGGASTGGSVPSEVVGRVSGVDGDSFEINGQRVRLIGIDAPEGPQMCQRDGRDWPCGRESANQLGRLVRAKDVTCAVEKADQHGRFLSVCRVDGRNLNQWMVANGWAVSYGKYKSDERAAKSAGKGLWSGTFERPRDWRDRKRAGG